MNAAACPPFSPPLLLPCQRQGKWRSKYRRCVHRNSGARCLLSVMTASAAVQIKRPGARKKLVFPLINCQAEQSESGKGGTLHRPGLAKQRLRGEHSCRHWLQALVPAAHERLRQPASLHLPRANRSAGSVGHSAVICTPTWGLVEEMVGSAVSTCSWTKPQPLWETRVN